MSRCSRLDFNNGIESDLLGLSICGTLHDEDKGGDLVLHYDAGGRLITPFLHKPRKGNAVRGNSAAVTQM